MTAIRESRIENQTSATDGINKLDLMARGDGPLLSLISKQPILVDAIVYLLQNNETEVSHAFHHTFSVMSLAASKATALEYSEGEKVNVCLMSVFHDMYRSSQRITDDEGFVRSVNAFADFCESENVRRLDIELMTEAMTNPRTENPQAARLSSILEFSDFAEFLNHERILMVVHENNTLNKLPLEASRKAYMEKFERKYKKLGDEAKKMLADFVSGKTSSGTENPLDLGLLAFPSDAARLAKPIGKKGAKRLELELRWRTLMALTEIQNVIPQSFREQHGVIKKYIMVENVKIEMLEEGARLG